MNDNIKNIELVKKSYEELQYEVIKLTTDKFKLQSNWNSLKEFVENDFTYDEYGMKMFDRSVLLDKINELEKSNNK